MVEMLHYSLSIKKQSQIKQILFRNYNFLLQLLSKLPHLENPRGFVLSNLKNKYKCSVRLRDRLIKITHVKL